jgi:phage terminase large subunit
MPTIDLSNYYDYFSPAFKDILYDDNRNLIMVGSAGSGKSYSAALKLIFRLLTEDDLTILVVRKTARSIRDSCFALLKDIIYNLGLEKLFMINKSDMTITTTINNSRIITSGLDDVSKLKSVVCQSVWIEEGSEITQQDYQQLNLRIRGKGNHQIIITFNPVSKYLWLKKYFFDRELENTTRLHTTYKDNEHLSKEYCQQLENLKETNRNMYEIYCLGEWSSNEEGLIYPNIKFGKPGKVKRTIYGMDFGFSNPTSIVKIDFDFEDNIYLTEVLYRTHMTTNEIIEEMNTLEISKFDYIYCDNAEPDRIKALKAAGYNAVACRKGKVEQGINIVKTYNIFTHESNRNINQELSSYSYIQKDGEYTDKADRRNDHALDAIRYALVSSLSYKVDTSIKQSDFFPTANNNSDGLKRLLGRI